VGCLEPTDELNLKGQTVLVGPALLGAKPDAFFVDEEDLVLGRIFVGLNIDTRKVAPVPVQGTVFRLGKHHLMLTVEPITGGRVHEPTGIEQLLGGLNVITTTAADERSGRDEE
jgi:hypothetical protein